MDKFTEDISRLADAIGCACEMQGMNAENQYRARQDLSPAYTEEHFFAVMEKWGVSEKCRQAQE